MILMKPISLPGSPLRTAKESAARRIFFATCSVVAAPSRYATPGAILVGTQPHWPLISLPAHHTMMSTTAQIALASSEAQVPNLIEMTYVGDEALSKLKPTARLSPKKKKVLIFVSDSSTALCKANRKGKLTKGDLAHEVDDVALNCGYIHAYYTMCWRKTLSWLAWQVEVSNLRWRRSITPTPRTGW